MRTNNDFIVVPREVLERYKQHLLHSGGTRFIRDDLNEVNRYLAGAPVDEPRSDA